MNYSQTFLVADAYEKSVFEQVEKIKSHVAKKECENLSIDITRLGLIDACKLAITYSSFHFTKYPYGRINWLVSDYETKRIISLFYSKNITVDVAKQTPTGATVIAFEKPLQVFS